VVWREHVAHKRSAEQGKQNNQPSQSSQSGKEIPEQRAVDTFIKVSNGSHGGAEKVAREAQSRQERAKLLDEWVIQEMGNPMR
jgi:hypothetical protein